MTSWSRLAIWIRSTGRWYCLERRYRKVKRHLAKMTGSKLSHMSYHSRPRSSQKLNLHPLSSPSRLIRIEWRLLAWLTLRRSSFRISLRHRGNITAEDLSSFLKLQRKRVKRCLITPKIYHLWTLQPANLTIKSWRTANNPSLALIIQAISCIAVREQQAMPLDNLTSSMHWGSASVPRSSARKIWCLLTPQSRIYLAIISKSAHPESSSSSYSRLCRS